MNLSNDARMALNLSVLDATERHHEFVGLEHLLGALLRSREVSRLIEGMGVRVEALLESLREIIEETHVVLPEDSRGSSAQPTLAFQRVVNRALTHAVSAGKEVVTAPNLLAAVFDEEDSHAVWLLRSQGIDRLKIVSAIAHTSDGGVLKDRDPVKQDREDPTSASGDPLDEYTVDLNQRAKEGRIDVLVGREAEVERCVTVLARRRKNNPVLVGDSGVGKTAIVEGLALRIVQEEVPEALRDVVIHSLDVGSLMAGTRYRGDFEERLKGVVRRIQETPGAVLFIDEIHNIVRMGAVEGGTLDASNLLKPALSDGSLRCIGSTTFEEYRRHFEKDRALARRFQKVEVVEPDLEDTVAILEGLAERYATFHGVTYEPECLRVAAELAARRIPERRLPDKAIDVIDEAGAVVKLTGREDLTVRRSDIEGVVARMARVPAEEVSSDDRERLASLREDLASVVFGQDEAIEALVAAVKLSRAGLGAPERPQGSYLFTGPTGVGKTEVARQLARTLGVPLLRFDMSEYMESHAVSRLIGAPPGYVGFEQGGQLTEQVTRNPHCVILLDEIEKAHPDVYNVLLQVMDAGTLTDNNGRSADFRHAVLIMTSNVGARELASTQIGFSRDVRMGSDEAAYLAAFSPEFRNRLDARIRFAPLKPEHMPRIVLKFLAEVETQLAAKKVFIKADEAALDLLAREGFDPVLGARPMARVIRSRVKQPLSEEVLFGDLRDGGQVLLTVRDDDLHFEIAAGRSGGSDATGESRDGSDTDDTG